jgi:hypothetical protein
VVDKVHHGPGVESPTAIDQDVPLVATKPLRFFDQNNRSARNEIDLHQPGCRRE